MAHFRGRKKGEGKVEERGKERRRKGEERGGHHDLPHT